jgi:GNAT superfamily N-acetyltransferase
MIDLICRQHFTGGSHVTLSPGLSKFPLPLSYVPQLVGAIDGSQIIVTPHGNAFGFEVNHDWLEAPMLRVLWRDADTGEFSLMWNEQFFLRPKRQRQGLGVRSLAVQLTTSLNLGIRYVGCLAAGRFGSIMNGYYTWPLLGFDAELEHTDMELLPTHLAHCTTLNELFLADDGPQHWRRHGRAMTVYFNLDPHSSSWAILDAYMTARSIQL